MKDSELDAVLDKKLIIVGTLNGCGNPAIWRAMSKSDCDSAKQELGISSGQFVIGDSDDLPGSRVALLVVGYNAADTVNAVTYLRTHNVKSDPDIAYKGTSATEALLCSGSLTNCSPI